MNICPAMCNEELFKSALYKQLVINFHYYEQTRDMPKDLLSIWDKNKILNEILNKLPNIYEDNLIDNIPTHIWNTNQFKKLCEDIFQSYRVEYLKLADDKYISAFVPSELAEWLIEWLNRDDSFKLPIDSFEKRKVVVERYYLNHIIKAPTEAKIKKI